MMPGFVEIDRQRFLAQIWPRIHAGNDPIQSNWREVRTYRQAGLAEPDLLIHWGHKNADTEEKIIVAITLATASAERYWIAPHLDE